jgi:hypothetical protein
MEMGKGTGGCLSKLKEMVASRAMSGSCDLEKPFRMETDASNFAYGAVLVSETRRWKYHPVAFMSKSMLPAERNYDIYDKEALGVVKPLQHWRYWLQGTRKPIQIITDHQKFPNWV